MKVRAGLFASFVVLCLVILMAPSLLAQTAGTGAIAGVVTDTTGAVVPNVRVTATNTGTGQTRTATTGGAGDYSIQLLPPGAYSVKFEVAGFETLTVPSVTVTVTETGTLNQTLTVGAQTQEITVQANVETVQTSNATVGSTVGSQTMTDLPLSSRNYTNLLSLTAGASADVTNASQLGKGTQEISVNGSAESSNNFQMDGATIVNVQSGDCCVENGSHAAFGIPNPDAIQEFKIQTSLYDAGYGQNPGANVNVVTKSGTNQFHGTAFEFFRNTVLNANDFFLKEAEFNSGGSNTRGALDQNQFGGVFGGPVKKDKLFFFVSYQQTAQKNGLFSGESTFFLPNLPSGDRSTAGFATALQNMYCGLGEGVDLAGPCVNAGTAPINPVALQLLQLKNPNGQYYIPTPAGSTTATGVSCGPVTGIVAGSSAGSAQCTASVPAIYHEYQGIGNFDYVINSKNTLSGRYFISHDPATQPFLGTPTALPGASTDTNYPNHAAVLKLTTILTSNLVNEARVSYQRDISFTTPAFAFTNNNLAPASATNVQITPVTPGIDTLDTFENTGSFFQMGAAPFSTTNAVTDQFQWADQISWTHGKQTIRAGFEWGHYQLAWFFPGLSDGFMFFSSFPNLLQGLAGCSPGTFGFAPGECNPFNPGGTNGLPVSDVLGTLNVTTRFAPGGGGDFHFHVNNASSFVQDDIKLNNRLTVNFGVRWEYDGLLDEIDGKNTNIYPALVAAGGIPQVASPCATPTVAYPAFPTVTNCGSYVGYVTPSNNRVPFPVGVVQSNHRQSPEASHQPLDNFAPRIGFAWQPLMTNRLVVRGGFGYFYDRLPTEDVIHAVLQSAPYANTVGLGFGPVNANSSLAQPFFAGQANWLPRWVTAGGASSNIGEQAVATNFATPLVYEYNLGIQYQFVGNWVLELGYVGSQGIHQFNGSQPINPAGLQDAAITGATPTISNVNLRVPYLGMSPTWSLESTNGGEKYNSLQATIRRQFSHGLLFQAAYTYSRALATQSVGINTFPYIVNEYGLNGAYHPQRLAVNYSYDLPFGHHQGITGKLTEGWSVSGTTTIQDGTPLTIVDSGTGGIFGDPTGGSVAQTAQFIGGAPIGTSGGIFSRVATGGPGYLNRTGAVGVVGPFLSSGSASFPTIGGGTLFGVGGLSQILGPGQDNWDISLAKITKVGGLREDATLQFRAEFFNAFNHPQFANPGSLDVTSASYGLITQTSVNPRLIQFALKYAF